MTNSMARRTVYRANKGPSYRLTQPIACRDKALFLHAAGAQQPWCSSPAAAGAEAAEMRDARSGVLGLLAAAAAAGAEGMRPCLGPGRPVRAAQFGPAHPGTLLGEMPAHVQ